VNWHQAELTGKILEAIPALASQSPFIRWVSPLAEDAFREYHDGRFLEAVSLGHLKGALREFWPKGGPHWDALATLHTSRGGAQTGVLLVEAKSHPEELRSGPCRARSDRSIDRIKTTLTRVKKRLNVSDDSDWMECPYYQAANRYAHLYFLREKCVAAWLVNVYFLRDESWKNSPDNRSGWEKELEALRKALGLESKTILDSTDVFLNAKLLRQPL
jgi:hypothetical protein